MEESLKGLGLFIVFAIIVISIIASIDGGRTAKLKSGECITTGSVAAMSLDTSYIIDCDQSICRVCKK